MPQGRSPKADTTRSVYDGVCDIRNVEFQEQCPAEYEKWRREASEAMYGLKGTVQDAVRAGRLGDIERRLDALEQGTSRGRD